MVMANDTDEVAGGYEPFIGDVESLSLSALIEEQVLLALAAGAVARRPGPVPQVCKRQTGGQGGSRGAARRRAETFCESAGLAQEERALTRNRREDHGSSEKPQVAFEARHAPFARSPEGPALSVDRTSGETHLRHRITPDGFYRGKKVIEKPAAGRGQGVILPASPAHDRRAHHRRGRHEWRPRCRGGRTGRPRRPRVHPRPAADHHRPRRDRASVARAWARTSNGARSSKRPRSS